MKTRILILLFITALTAHGAVVIWTNTSGGFWSANTNWSPNTVPTAGDAVFITNTGAYTVTQDVHVSVANLTLGGASGTQTLTNAAANLTLNGASLINSNGVLGFGNGTLVGAGLLTVSGHAIWGAGSWHGRVLVAPGGALDLVGNVDKTLSGSVTNQGTMTWSGTNHIYMADGRINNLPGALFDIQNNQLILYSSGAPNVSNSGVIRKSSGGGDSTIAVPLINSGTLDVLSGRVGYWSGSQFNSGTAFTGAGTNTIYTGTVTFNGALTSENLEITSDGSLSLVGSHTLSGTARWIGGAISGAMNIATNGTLHITGTLDRSLWGSLANQGRIVWSGVNTIYLANGHLTNLASGVFDIQNNQILAYYSGVPNVHNSGIIRKSSGGGDSTIAVPLINSGTLEVLSGRVGYWSGSQFNSGTAFTGSGTNTIYTGTVTFNGAVTSENLEITSDGSLSLAGTHILSGTTRWIGGTISGATIIATNGTLNISGTAVRAVSGSLINRGLMVWSGPNTIHLSSGYLTNLTSGVFEIQNNQIILVVSGVPNVHNSGIIRKSSGGGVSVIAAKLINSGTLDVQSGQINYWAGSQFNSGTAFTGSGTNTVYTGTVTFNGAITSENLEIASDNSLTLAGNHTLNGTVRWTGGTISGAMTIATNSTLNIFGTADHALSGSLNNQGLVTWAGANTIYVHNAPITNDAGAVFEVQNNQVLFLYNGAQKFNNRGTIRKSAGGGDTVITVPVLNTGILDVQSGRIAYGTGCQFNSGTLFTGPGTNFVYTGIATFNGVIPSENLEIASDSTLSFGGNCTFSGVVNWTGGALADDSAFTIATNGVLRIRGTADRSVVGSLTNRGTITWSGVHNIDARLSARIVNEQGALFDIQNDQVLLIYNGAPRVINNGTIRKSTGGGDTFITVPVINAGTLEVQSGRIAYGPNGQFNTGTTFTGAGTNLLYNGNATFNGAISSDNLEIGGAVILGTNTLSGFAHWTSGAIGEDARMTIPTNTTLNLPGTLDRTVQGALINAGLVNWSGGGVIYFVHLGTVSNLAGGTFDMQADGVLAHNSGVSTFRNAGLLRKSSGTGNSTINLSTFQNTGTLDAQNGTIVFGNYTQAGGKLSFGLNSLTNFGRLAFANNVTFTGTLGVNLNGGYLPMAGDAFAVITYPSRTGTFADFALPSSHAWQTNSSIYGANAVTLTVLNARPTLDPISNQTGDEETVISFTATATDPDPMQTRLFSLLGAPSGATMNSNTGDFSWTPNEAQGPSTYQFAVQVSDNGVPPLTHTQSVNLVVNEVNRAPVVTPITLAPINELIPFVLATNLATDPDLPANVLGFALINPLPGALIDAATGLITWTPTEVQGPSTNAISVRITDSGSSHLSATNNFTLVVTEVNTAPSLAPLFNCTHVAGAMCWITNAASDPDLPANQLTFILVNPPPGMSIGPTSGLITWAPPLISAPSTNSVTVLVADDGPSELADEQSFVATLISPPHLSISPAGPSRVVLSWPAAATEAGFGLQSTTNLSSASGWQNIAGTPVVTAGENFLTNSASAGFRAYRLASPLTPLPILQIGTANSNAVLITDPLPGTQRYSRLRFIQCPSW